MYVSKVLRDDVIAFFGVGFPSHHLNDICIYISFS